MGYKLEDLSEDERKVLLMWSNCEKEGEAIITKYFAGRQAFASASLSAMLGTKFLAFALAVHMDNTGQMLVSAQAMNELVSACQPLIAHLALCEGCGAKSREILSFSEAELSQASIDKISDSLIPELLEITKIHSRHDENVRLQKLLGFHS